MLKMKKSCSFRGELDNLIDCWYSWKSNFLTVFDVVICSGIDRSFVDTFFLM